MTASTFDERCAALFADDEESAHAFKRAMTSERGRLFIAVSQQHDLARLLVAELGKAKNRRRDKARFIRIYVNKFIKALLFSQLPEEERNRQRGIEAIEKRRRAFDRKIDTIVRHLNGATRDAMWIRDVLEENPDMRSVPIVALFAERKQEILCLLDKVFSTLPR